MKYLLTLIWTVGLVTMLNYIAGAIANIGFDFQPGIIVAIIASVFIMIIGNVLPEGEVADH